nr:DUF2786 domain-containing protein [Rhodococcus sp. HNM0569]
MLTRIGGLLRQAESTDNEHEAEAFMAAAQRLATASSIDLAVARSHTRGRERRQTPTQRVVHIGEAGKKGLRTYAHLYIAIAAANDVQCDITQTSTTIFAYGFASDLDVCERLYSSLLIQMVRASDAYVKSGAYRSETTPRRVVDRRRRTVRLEHRPVAGVTARLEFQTAYAARIGARLADAKAETEAQATAAPETSQETALALRDKQLELRDYYREHSDARGSWRGTRASAGHSSHARRAGDRAARTARLGPADELPGARRQLREK